MSARVVASDVSRPTTPTGTSVSVTGTVTFSGLTVELWDGQRWLSAVNGPGSATINLGDGSAQATLVPATEIPAGDYSKVRLSATDAAVDASVNGQGFSARLQGSQPVTVEKTVTVMVNPDGSRTFSVQLEMVRTVTLELGPAGVPTVRVAGDLGTMTAAAATAPGSVVASDVSRPTTTPAGMSVSGNVTFTGLRVDLWNGQDWLPVVNGSGSASVTIGDGAASATLVPTSEIAAGTYSQVRLAATQAVIDLSLSSNGQQFSAQVAAPSGQPVVIQKEVTVTVNPDGSRTFSVQLEMVRTVALQIDQTTGAAQLAVAGDFGSASAMATHR